MGTFKTPYADVRSCTTRKTWKPQVYSDAGWCAQKLLPTPPALICIRSKGGYVLWRNETCKRTAASRKEPRGPLHPQRLQLMTQTQMLGWVNRMWHKNWNHFWRPACENGNECAYYYCFTLQSFSPIVNWLKNVCLSILVVNMMQNILRQIVPSLIWVEFQYCLQTQQLQHQNHHHLLVVNLAVTSLIVRK